MWTKNSGIDFDTCYSIWFDESCYINLPAVCSRVYDVKRKNTTAPGKIASLLRAITCLDLTTLSGDDTYSNLQRLCYKATYPIKKETLSKLGFHEQISCAAVCVHPANVIQCTDILSAMGSSVPVASVAAGFPSGQTYISTKVDEICECRENGAKEIDIVISRELVLSGKWNELYQQVKRFSNACYGIKLKTIIAAGELGSLTNVYKASIICMAAGADFIKTSTGKESVNATHPIGLVMTRAIKDYYNQTGYKVGFKPAGGIRTSKDVWQWQRLMQLELGKEWLYPELFRIGASGLLGDIEMQLNSIVTGKKQGLPYL